MTGSNLLKFREDLLKSSSQRSLKEMMKTITPPKGVKRVVTAGEPHVDEGHELHDCEGEEEAMDLLLNEELEIELEIENVELTGPSHVRNDENDDVVPPPAEAFNGDAESISFSIL